MSRLFGYTATAANRDTAAIEAFEHKKLEAQSSYWFVYVYIIHYTVNIAYYDLCISFIGRNNQTILLEKIIYCT